MEHSFEAAQRTRTGREKTRHTTIFSHHSCGTRGGIGRHRNTSQPLFKPGATVPESGIYEVIHDNDHRQAHDAVMIVGNAFPACETCEDRVRFRIVRTAPYIFQDQDFGE